MQNLFSAFPQFVDDELKRRRTGSADSESRTGKPYRGGAPAGLQKPKSTWMRFASGYKPQGGSRKILMGGDLSTEESLKFGFEELYQDYGVTGERKRPAPTIESISVNEKLESFECTVNWTAFGIQQLEELFPFFMNLGTTAIVDFGWSDVDPTKIIDVSDTNKFRRQFATIGQSDLNSEGGATSASVEFAPKTLSRYDTPKYQVLKGAEGKYSFVAGYVSDFSFSPDDNNVYSCSTTISSLSKALSALRTGAEQKNRRDEEESEDTPPTFEEFFLEQYNSYLQKSASEGNKDVVKVDEDLSRRDDTKSNQTYYVSWKKLESIVNQIAGAFNQNTGGTTSAGGQAALGPKFSTKQFATFKLDSSNSIISNVYAADAQTQFVSLRSTNPYVCLVDNQVTGMFRTFFEEPSTASVKENAYTNFRGFLHNLYVHEGLVREAFENNEMVVDALLYVLNKASAACFNIWNFEAVVDSNVIKFRDRNAAENNVGGILSNGQMENVFTFRPNTDQSILRDFSFDTNLDDSIKSQIIAQKHSVGKGGNENAAINFREDSTPLLFQNKYGDGKDVVSENNAETQTEDVEPKGKNKNVYREVEKQAFNFTEGSIRDFESDKTNTELVKAIPKDYQNPTLDSLLYRNINVAEEDEGSGISLGEQFAFLLQSSRSESSPVNANNVVPINAQFTLDGVGGLSAFQGIRIKNIPKLFIDEGIFIIDEISHEVGIDDWTTEVKSKFTPRNQFAKSQQQDG